MTCLNCKKAEARAALLEQQVAASKLAVKELEDALDDMLCQFSVPYFHFMSAEEHACKALNHPLSKYTIWAEPKSKGCFCSEKKYGKWTEKEKEEIWRVVGR